MTRENKNINTGGNSGPITLILTLTLTLRNGEAQPEGQAAYSGMVRYRNTVGRQHNCYDSAARADKQHNITTELQ